MKDPVDIKATCFLHFKLKKKKREWILQLMRIKNPQAIFRKIPAKHIKNSSWAARWISR